MSADNGIYIHKFRNGFAVIHAQAIENIYSSDGNKYNPKILAAYFRRAKRFTTQAQAFQEAQRLYDKIMKDDFCSICEYGIRIV